MRKLKKNLIFVSAVLFFAVNMYAEKIYVSSDGYYTYHFADDFSEYKYLDPETNTFSEVETVQKSEKNGIEFWKVAGNEYVMLAAKDYFLMQDYQDLFIFVKNYDSYWANEPEVSAYYEATSEKKAGSKQFGALNLLYFSFEPWISSSDKAGVGESIKIESEIEFDQFRIVNGFIDLKRPKLYNEYGRVKTLKVYDQNNTSLGTFEIKDASSIQEFKLPSKTKSIKIEIADTYKGDKQNEVAISVLQCY